MQIKIGSLNINNPVLLAPMSGVTDKPFRYLVGKFGCSLLTSEMIASRAMIIETQQSCKKAELTSHPDSVNSIQIAGCDPIIMAEAAKLCADLGADIIDINFGCPVKKVVNGYAGSALMKDEKLATQIMAAVVKAVNIPVTMKTRMGWNTENLNAPSLAKKAEDVGIQMITIHGRTRCQMYNGKANWKFIKNVKEAVNIPVIANGDIKTIEDVVTAIEDSRADGIMIGRGAYGKPWLIKQVAHYLNTKELLPEPSLEEKQNIIIEHYKDMIEHYGEDVGIRMARKHIGWYSAGFYGSAEFRKRIMVLNNYEAVIEEIRSFFTNFTDANINETATL